VGGEKQPELQKLYELRDTLKLHAFIKFVGQQHQHELPFYYNAADVVVMPSHYESFGMSALEAMACGTPVVTTNVSGISTMFENNGHHAVISANNPIMLAQAIEKIISAEASRFEMPRIINFTWAKMAKKMEKVYEELTSAKLLAATPK
jgi:D-inositol-3-phosphate glycosyltransferase